MSIPLRILERLRYGKPVVAEIAAAEPNMRAYLEIIPQVPDVREEPEAYMYQGGNVQRHILRDLSLITGYEIRLLKHDSKYVDKAWGFQNDWVLYDKTTRMKCLFVKREKDIEQATAPWLPDAASLHSPEKFGSSLVDSLTWSYSSLLEQNPHLWLED